MIAKKLFRTRTLVAGVVILLLMITAYAYAAANTVPETGAGDGAEAISGYTISDVEYTLGADPSQIGAVTFDIAPTAGAAAVRDVRVQLIDGGAWFNCDESGAPSVTCTITGVAVADADNFRVVAVQ